jgi:hypothetical protein
MRAGILNFCLVFVVVTGFSMSHAQGLRAGVGRAVITPELPAWLSGYASRTEPATEVLHDLWAKALVLDDGAGGRAVVVTTDLIGLPREISESAAAQIQKKHRLKRSQLLFNSSHTHTGPAVRPNLSVMYNWGPDYDKRSRDYAERLTGILVRVVDEALNSLAPARLSVGHGVAGFAMNRRESTPQGFRIGVNPAGPVDHDVPVLEVADPAGKPRAILFGYACHNTTLTGQFLKVSGDYAGFAQLELERRYPGATAMFMMLCGGDQNPNPRSTLEYAESHGRLLAEAVVRARGEKMRSIQPRIRAAHKEVKLHFAEHRRDVFETELKSGDRFRERRARLMLDAYDRGRPVRSIPYPVQVVRLDDRLVILALAGEVVVDYAKRAKGEFSQLDLVVAGYSNEVSCYIPSARVLSEGGYEPNESMIYYGQPGPLRADVEERIFGGIRSVMRKAGFK